MCGNADRDGDKRDVFDNVLTLKIWHEPIRPDMIWDKYEWRAYDGEVDE